MAEVYIVINKIQLSAFTIAFKMFHHLDDNVWDFTDGWKVLLKKLQYFCGGWSECVLWLCRSASDSNEYWKSNAASFSFSGTIFC